MKKNDLELENYKLIVQEAFLGIWLLNEKAETQYLNPCMEKILGFSLNEIMGKSFYDFCSPEEVVTVKEKFKNNLLGISEKFDCELHSKKGEVILTLVCMSPVRKNNDLITGFVGMFTDITHRRVSEIALRESESKLYQLASIIESSDDAIFSTDLEANATTWNKGAEELFGFSAEEVIGKSLVDRIVPKDKRKESLFNLNALREDTPIHPYEAVLQKKDGTKIDTLITLSRIKDRTGNTLGASVIARDITPGKKAEKERDELLSQLDQLIEIAPIGIAFINEKLQYVKINRMLAHMNGIPVEAHLNKTPQELLPEHVSEIITKNLKQVLKHNRVFISEVMTPSPLNSAENRWWAAIYYPIKLSLSSVGIGAIIQDITDQKLIDKRKDDFLAMSSHELKTPVTTIKAFTQILQHIVKIDDKRAQQYLKKIDSEANRLTKLINDFLDVSKIKNGTLRIIKEEFLLNELVQEIVSSYQKIEPTSQITLKGMIATLLYADKIRISQVIRNLVENALKYSPDNKKITVSMCIDKKIVKFSVKDHGIGISAENQKRIFQSFYRVFESENVEFPGLGIGLYISSEIIKAHGGEITVQSKKGAGAEFTVSLPIGK